LKKKKGKKESSEKILVIFFVFGNEFSFSNYYFKNLFEKKNERETEKEKEKECKRERKKERKKDREKKKIKKWEFGLKMADLTRGGGFAVAAPAWLSVFRRRSSSSLS
jgi:FKBP-type peptidyl-prolyl cis-trans isomerase